MGVMSVLQKALTILALVFLGIAATKHYQAVQAHEQLKASLLERTKEDICKHRAGVYDNLQGTVDILRDELQLCRDELNYAKEHCDER